MYYRSPCLFFRNIVRSNELMLRGSPRPLRALGLLARPLRARGLLRSLSDHSSGTSSLAPRPVLGDCLDHSPTMARGLCVSTTCDWQLAYSWDIFSHLDLATRLIPRLPASSGTTSVRCTCRCISYRLYDDWILNLTGNSFLDPSTMCLRHLLPGSGTKCAHFTLR